MASIKEVIARFTNITKIDTVQIVDQQAHLKVIDFAKKQFDTSGKYGGKPWAFYGSEPKYLRYKLALGARPIPLRWTTNMERVYPALTNPNDPNHNWRKRGNNVYLDISIPYLARIETGGRNQFNEPAPGRSLFPNDNRRLSGNVLEAVKREYYRRVGKT